MSRSLRVLGLLTASLLALATPAGAQAPPPSTPQQPPVAIAAPPAELTLRADQVERLARALTQADSHGLPAAAFAPEAALAMIGSRDRDQRRAGQARLVTLTLAYAKAVHVGRLNTADFIVDWGLRPTAYDPWTDFTAALAQDRLGPWLDSLPPPYAGYQNLQRGLVTYRAIAARGGWRPLAAGAPLKPGMTDPRVPELRRRLAVEDAAVAVEGADLYDPALVQAVMRAQKRFGLDPDGGLGPQTLAALNVPVQRRIDQILANMERWRWLPQTLPADRIQVNIAAAVMIVFQDDKPALSMRAVTGRPGDETPMLMSKIHSIVLNPPWNVPSSIATKELWPKERAHPGYLKANDFVVISTGDGGTRLQQVAGPKAALGKLKFDFLNPYGVYLHDTPSRAKFASFSRLASHGCVRLEKPVELAKLLLAGDATWTPEVIDATLAGGKTVRAQLPEQTAVFLLYWTAFMTPDGQVNFRDDPYGWDTLLMQRIVAIVPGSA